MPINRYTVLIWWPKKIVVISLLRNHMGNISNIIKTLLDLVVESGHTGLKSDPQEEKGTLPFSVS